MQFLNTEEVSQRYTLPTRMQVHIPVQIWLLSNSYNQYKAREGAILHKAQQALAQH